MVERRRTRQLKSQRARRASGLRCQIEGGGESVIGFAICDLRLRIAGLVRGRRHASPSNREPYIQPKVFEICRKRAQRAQGRSRDGNLSFWLPPRSPWNSSLRSEDGD